MAIFRLQITSLGRNAGRRATAAAAYRAGERVRDERTGELHNYSKRKDVVHAEIFLPARLESSADWARDRSRLWNAAELAESRRTARVAREFQVILPAELSPQHRLQLARTFSQHVADRYGIAVDLAVHDPRPDGDPRNFHAHLLATTREVTATGLGAKAGLDMGLNVRVERGLPSSSQEFIDIRASWATLTNAALREAGLEARVDHRSLAAQGIDRAPRPFIPLEEILIERSGRRSELAERVRSEYRARFQARRAQARRGESRDAPGSAESRSDRAIATQGQANAAQGQANVGEATAARAVVPGTGAAPTSQSVWSDPRSLDEIRRDAALKWREMRLAQAAQPDATRTTHAQDSAAVRSSDKGEAKARTRSAGVDDDFLP